MVFISEKNLVLIAEIAFNATEHNRENTKHNIDEILKQVYGYNGDKRLRQYEEKGGIIGMVESKAGVEPKTLDITEVKGARANISDITIYGDGDTFALLCKASSAKQGWMKSTKVCNVTGGCLVQVSTQQTNPDGSYAVAEALTYVPGVMLDKDSDPRRLVPYKETIG